MARDGVKGMAMSNFLYFPMHLCLLMRQTYRALDHPLLANLFDATTQPTPPPLPTFTRRSFSGDNLALSAAVRAR